MRVLRSTGEAAGLGDRAEVAELVEFHEAVLSFATENGYRQCLFIVSELDIGTIGRREAMMAAALVATGFTQRNEKDREERWRTKRNRQ